MAGIQGQRPAEIVTQTGDSAMDDTNDALRVNVVAGGAGDGSILDGVTSSIKATVFDYTNANPVAVRLTDTNGDFAAAGGGTQYTEDAAAAANPTGTAPILVRADTPAGVVTTDGDNVAQRGTNFGAAYVQVVSSAGAFVDTFGGGTQYTEDAAAAADPVGTALIMVRADTPAAVTSTDGDNIAARATNKGELYVKHIDSIPVTDNAGSLTVDNAALSVVGGGVEATALRVTLASDSTGLVSVDDNAGSLTVDNAALSVTGGGVEATALRVTVATDSTGVLSVDDNGGSLTVDNTVLSVVGGGTEATAQRVTIANDSTGVLSVDDNGGSLTVDGTITATCAGDVAHDSGDSGNPVKVGGKAIAYGANPTAVTANDRTDWYFNRHGVPFVIGGHPNIITRSVLITDANGAQTDASVVGTIGAGTKVAVTELIVTVDSATTATGGVAVRLGFGATNVPTQSSTGVAGMLFDHPGIAAGSGAVRGNGSAVIGIGADGEELRLTCEDPTGGNLTVTFSYFTIES